MFNSSQTTNALEYVSSLAAWRDVAVFAGGASLAAVYIALLVKFVKDANFRRAVMVPLEALSRAIVLALTRFFDVGSMSYELKIELPRAENSGKRMEPEGYLPDEEFAFSQKMLSSDPIDQFHYSRFKLERAYQAVSARGIFSLVAGGVAAIFAMFQIHAMISEIDVKSIEEMSVKSITYISVARASLAVFVILVTYFFFGLYKRSLDELKYYQNELTNIQIWLAAYLSSTGKSSVSDVQASILSELIRHDRNNSVPQVNGSNDLTAGQFLELIKSFLESGRPRRHNCLSLKANLPAGIVTGGSSSLPQGRCVPADNFPGKAGNYRGVTATW